VPPRALLPEERGRVPPHIYTTEEIAKLMDESRRLSPPLRAATIEPVLGLLVVTGMRSGEAVRLERDDVDLEAARLRIIATKFDKSRELALHPTAMEAPPSSLVKLHRLRTAPAPLTESPGLFRGATTSIILRSAR
jgi:integrase